MKLRKLAAMLMCGSLAVSAVGSICQKSFSDSEVNGIIADAADHTTMRDISTFDVIKEMGYGINLGNTFESCGSWITNDGNPNTYETAWGSPTITKQMIQGYANEGFGVLRVPVAWSNLMSTDGKYTISSAYINRVKEVIDWALDANLYVIMNLHWDGGWLENLPKDYTNCMNKYSAIWTQLCAAFGDYGDHLVFESQNEELYFNEVWNQWDGQGDKAKAYGYCNDVNQRFVDIVRKSGGNNAKRHLLISGYYTDVNLTCDPAFKMPSDPAGKCAVSVHYYIPSKFAILEEDAEWGECVSTWGTAAEYSELSGNMDKLKKTFVDNGVPVIIGEFGCPTKNKDPESVTKFLSAVCDEALKRGGICPVLWDTTGLHYSRTSCKMNVSKVQENFAASKAKHLGDVTPVQPTTAVTTTVKTTTTTTTTTTKAEVTTTKATTTTTSVTTTTTATQPVTEPKPVATLNGKLLGEVKIYDGINANNWFIESDYKRTSKLFCDSGLNCDLYGGVFSDIFYGAERLVMSIRSEAVKKTCAKVTAGDDAIIYIIFDNSRDQEIPSWVEQNGFVRETRQFFSIPQVTYTGEIYVKHLKTGESIEIGTNEDNAGVLRAPYNYTLFAKPEHETYKIGDVDNDGDIDSMDLTLVRNIAVHGRNTVYSVNYSSADITQDGSVGYEDITKLQNYILGKIDKL